MNPVMRLTDVQTPFVGPPVELKPEWIDYNGHLNAGFFFVVFDEAVAHWLDFIGLGFDHKAEHRVTTFSVEGHITFEREVHVDDPLEIRTQLLGWDVKKIHYINFMHHRAEGWLAATNELLTMHISTESRRSAPMADSVQHRLGLIAEAHSELPVPAQVGRVIGLRSGRPASG